MNVQELIDELSKVENKKIPVAIWINSQAPVEPMYTGGDRIPVAHIDNTVEGIIDICCEGCHQEHAGRHCLNVITDQGMLIGEAICYFEKLLNNCKGCKFSNEYLYEIAFYKFILNNLHKLKEDFEFMQKFGVAKNGPTPAQIKEYLELCLLENVEDI